jgi:hypothetical protein
MAQALNTDGYKWLRGLVKNNGVYLELQESDGTPVIRLSTADDRVSWTHTDGDNPMELEVTLTGTDSDLS